MQNRIASPVPALFDALTRDGFSFVIADVMRPLLQSSGELSDWDAFVESWNHLGPDPYLAATGRLRRRRHASYTATPHAGIELMAHQPHYQALQYNRLQGDIERWFEPIETQVANGASLRAVLGFCNGFFSSLAPAVARWHVEVHQFRIEASSDAAGEPTPEGSHRDGVDFVLVLLIDRQNIASGTTTIHTPDGQLLGDFTLTHAFDAALIHDPRVFHGVTPVTPLVPGQPAHRDVLVVTFRAKA
ncbi:2OG-Fe dioxygenase family protein [Dyella sp.]|uniref:2OG-Fe dioxygenase family protein n=1 Tax=Dyella sp. TaxID=1869338 RepID=UPI002D7752C9|nr:2OG-Fe dioxygenase family protein [Dyella sp.]HET7330038.1 2OG-Fe dioxygenase family protein [Dyella sp.]